MAYYSKYSGKEVDERLDRVDSIPTKISQLLNDKDYITEIELKAILDKIPIVDFSKIPIDEDTIYWSENSDGKLVLKSKGGGGDSNWSVKKDSNGNKYIYTELPVVTQYGITMYGNNGDIDLPSLYAGLPIDGQTIYWDNGVLKSLGGGGEGLDEEALRNYLLINGYVTKGELPSLDGYATESWVLNLGYIGPEGLKNYVDISSNQDINGKKNFKSGISINGLDIYQSQDDVIYLDANLVVRGGITMYSINEADIPSIVDYIPTASTTTKGIASFDDSFFTVDSNGKVSLINSSSGGGIDETELEAYLTSNNYAKKSDIPSLSGYATESWVNTRINSLINGAPAAYDTLKEIADVLQGNVNSIGDIITALGTKWTQDNTKIANWDAAYSWGNHADVGYALKTYVDSELTKYVTLGGTQTITGEKNFTGGLKVNGSPIYYDSTKKYWKLEGDLLVTGGVTMYGSDSSFTPSTIMDALLYDDTTLGINSNGELYVKGGTSGGGLDITALQNYLTQNSYLNVTSGDNRYLQLSGGTLTISSYEDFIIKRNVNGGFSGITYSNANEGALGYIGVGGSDSSYPYQPMFVARGKESHKIWHSGNFSPSNYLPLSGGILKGSQNVLIINRTDLNQPCIAYEYNGTSYGSVGLKGYGDPFVYNASTKKLSQIYHKENISTLKTDLGLGANAYTSTAYLPLSGGTLSSNSRSPLTLKSGSAENHSLLLFNRGSDYWGAIGFNATNSLIFKDTNGTNYAIWNSANDGSGSGLDADLLDGQHGEWHRNNVTAFARTNYTSTQTHDANVCITGMMYNYGSLSYWKNTPDMSYGQILTLRSYGSNELMGQLAWDIRHGESDTTRYLWWRGIQNESRISSAKWHQIAFTDSNVASATKLQTARTIWGQSFDGTGNIDGVITINQSTTNASILINSTHASLPQSFITFQSNGVDKGNVGWTNASGTHLYNASTRKTLELTNDGELKYGAVANGVVIWRADNSNLSTVNWTASDLYCYCNGAERQFVVSKKSYTWGGLVNSYPLIGTTSAADNDIYTMLAFPHIPYLKNGSRNYNGNSFGSLVRFEGDVTNGKYWDVGCPSESPNNLFIKCDGKNIASWGNSGLMGIYVPNQWLSSSMLVLGRRDASLMTNQFAQIGVTDGNIHVDAYKGYGIYLNFYQNNTGVVIDKDCNLLVSGGITMYSDQRKKTILNHVELSLKQIADAPLIEHYYNSDESKTTHVGSIAQYWANMNDWFCKLDSEGYYTMEIQNAALASAISIARELNRYETKTDKAIKKLKMRICELEEEVERLKSA